MYIHICIYIWMYIYIHIYTRCPRSFFEAGVWPRIPYFVWFVPLAPHHSTFCLSPLWVSWGRYPLVFSGWVWYPLDSRKVLVRSIYSHIWHIIYIYIHVYIHIYIYIYTHIWHVTHMDETCHIYEYITIAPSCSPWLKTRCIILLHTATHTATQCNTLQPTRHRACDAHANLCTYSWKRWPWKQCNQFLNTTNPFFPFCRIHTYMYILISIYMYMNIYEYIYIYICMFVHIYIYIYI